ncbi:hypothetical protein QK290_18425, partial [Pseudarthrobacter sp. AL07]
MEPGIGRAVRRGGRPGWVVAGGGPPFPPWDPGAGGKTWVGPALGGIRGNQGNGRLAGLALVSAALQP